MTTTIKCDEHDNLCNDVKMIKVSAFETSRSVELIKTNHLPHLQAGLDRLESAMTNCRKLINWVIALVGACLAIVGIGVALIGILQVME